VQWLEPHKRQKSNRNKLLGATESSKRLVLSFNLLPSSVDPTRSFFGIRFFSLAAPSSEAPTRCPLPCRQYFRWQQEAFSFRGLGGKRQPRTGNFPGQCAISRTCSEWRVVYADPLLLEQGDRRRGARGLLIRTGGLKMRQFSGETRGNPGRPAHGQAGCDLEARRSRPPVTSLPLPLL
jgi:hypothetical protein